MRGKKGGRRWMGYSIYDLVSTILFPSFCFVFGERKFFTPSTRLGQVRKRKASRWALVF